MTNKEALERAKMHLNRLICDRYEMVLKCQIKKDELSEKFFSEDAAEIARVVTEIEKMIETN